MSIGGGKSIGVDIGAPRGEVGGMDIAPSGEVGSSPGGIADGSEEEAEVEEEEAAVEEAEIETGRLGGRSL